MTARGPLRIRVRRATEADGRAVLAFTREIWGGRDYLPDVWAAWLRARDGVLLAAEVADGGKSAGYRLPAEAGSPAEAEQPAEDGSPAEVGAPPDGVPIAVARIAVLTLDEAWLEGLRVDPAVQGQGVATALQVAELAWAQAQGAGMVRYATGEMNRASLHLGSRHGFAPAGRWRAVRPGEPGVGRTSEAAVPPRDEVLARLAKAGLPVPTRRLDGVRRRLGGDPTFLRSGELYEWRAWAWQALTADRLERHAEKGELLEVTNGSSWAIGLLAHERLPGATRVVLLGGDDEAALRIVEAVTSAAGRPPSLRLPDPSPLLQELTPRLSTGGWSIGEHAVVLMARALVDEDGSGLPLPEDGAERLEFAERPRHLGLLPAT